MDLDSMEVLAAFDFIEVLVPIIFVVLWGIGKAFGAKEEDTDTEAPPAPETSDRTRNIFREIERKMAERRRQAESGPAAPPTLHEEPPVMPRQQPAQQFPRGFRGSEPPPLTQSPAFSPAPPISTRDYKKELAIQMQQLREAKEEQEQLLLKAETKAKKSAYRSWDIKGQQSAESWEIKVRSSHSSHFKKDLISLLQDADGTRKAVLYYEILGPPVALRRGQGVTHFS